ncbi:MAG TPA: hypothetical protein VLK82_15720 [Candidatus Tectomicrobia bacterium]|nr:hypothetical protein [Candidatus Tectomicrobia bacterium]
MEEGMPIVRVQKHQHNYVMIDKQGLEDERLSIRARGLLAVLLAKPDGWEINLAYLASHNPREGREALANAMHELEQYGYAAKQLQRDAMGKLHGYVTVVYETPDLASTEVGKTEVGKTEVGKTAPSNNTKTTRIQRSKGYKDKWFKTPPPPSSGETEASEVLITPEEFVALYNANIPHGIPQVKTLSPERRKKIVQYVQHFPAREFWITCFRAPYNSAFLRGEHNRPGHEHFTFDIDFLLRKGKDGTENCVKVYEGKYADQPQQEHSQPDRPDAMEDLSPRTQEIIKQAQRSYERMMSNPRWNPAARKDDHAQP